ncbi:MAG: transporter, partial [Candidatus Eremiobacteraeota bacterium]|nr:transporter [Candidatus Eremiobacteraeota bacterium]
CGGLHTDILATLNRPTVGFSACAVKPRETLAELGYQNEASLSGIITPTYPQGFIRFGVGPNFEADLIAPEGHYDSGVGLKYELYHDAKTAYAIDVLYTSPNGAPAFTAGKATTTVNFNAGTSLGGKFNGGITLGYQRGAFTTWLPSVSLVDQFSPKTQVYVEAFGATRVRVDGGSRFAYDGGIQHLLTNDLEIDVEAGRTVTDVDRSHYYGFGFGLRL